MNKNYALELSKEDIALEIARFNPLVASVSYTSTEEPILISIKPAHCLKLPYGWYWDGKKSITNKNKTKSGSYTSVEIIFTI